MGTSALAHVVPDVLRWARESAGYSVHQAADKSEIKWHRLEGAERGDDLLTLREAERAAKTYERPLASLLLPEPPAEEPQEAVFRRLPGAPEPPWPPELKLLARRIARRQEAAIELYELLEEKPPWIVTRGSFRVEASPVASAQAARELLGIDEDEQRTWWQRDLYAPLRAWTGAIEAQGILVMQDGRMGVEEFRGFASVEPEEVPAIVINTKDDPRARAFTAAHEFGHLLLGQSTSPTSEQWCNAFAAELLMPAVWFRREFGSASKDDRVKRATDLGKTFGVTPLAAAIRASTLELAPSAEAAATIAVIRERGHGSHQRGGTYYRNQIAWFGRSFVRLVLDAVDTQVVTYPTASTLLEGVKVQRFDRLRDALEQGGD